MVIPTTMPSYRQRLQSLGVLSMVSRGDEAATAPTNLLQGDSVIPGFQIANPLVRLKKQTALYIFHTCNDSVKPACHTPGR